MKNALAALCVLVTGATAHAQTENCNAQLDQLSDILVSIDVLDEPIASTAIANETGGCLVKEIVLPSNSVLVIKAERMTWTGTGMDRFAAEGLPPTSLELDIDGLQYLADIGDPVMTYLLELQSHNQKIDMSLRLSWDADARELDLERAELSFASGDYMRFSADVEGVDLTDWATIQMSAGSFGVTEATWEFRSFGLFEQLLAMPLGLPLLQGAEDPAQRVEELKSLALNEIARLPGEIFPKSSRQAMADLVGDMPHPAGTFRVTMSADPGLGVARAMPLATSRQGLESLEQLWQLLEGVRYDIRYERR